MNINRAQLAKFLPDNESVRIFEEIASTATQASESAGVVSSLTSPVTAVNTTLVSSGLSASIAARSVYKFEFFGVYSVASDAIGTRWTIDGPASEILAYRSQWALTASSESVYQSSAFNLPASPNASSAALLGNTVKIEGIIKPTANGTLQMRFASGGVSDVILLAGLVRIVRLT
jgi:hypothetical protein